MRSMDLNIFSQVGLLMLIGLAAKNAILVVEFADQRMANGLGQLKRLLRWSGAHPIPPG